MAAVQLCGFVYAMNHSPGVSAGVHSNTKVYIDPSNKDWIKPRQNTTGSDLTKK